MADLDEWLERVYAAAGDSRTLARLYDAWAVEYDEQLWASGNPYIAISGGMAARYIPDTDALILDAGCGTGNMATLLQQLGFQNIEGLDPSAGMLKVARHKRLFKATHELSLGAEVDLPHNSYDAIVAAGIFTQGHAPPEALDGIVNLVKPGGIIIFSLTEFANDELGFKEKLSQLEDAGIWRAVERSPLTRSFPFSEQTANVRFWVCVFQKS